MRKKTLHLLLFTIGYLFFLGHSHASEAQDPLLLDPLQSHHLNRAVLAADAHVGIRSGSAADVAKADEDLWVMVNRSGVSGKVYIRFDVSDLSNEYFDGTAFFDFVKDDWRRHDIRFWVLSGSADALTWDPETLKWNNAPANDASADSLVDSPDAPAYAILLGTWTSEDTRGGNGNTLSFPFEIKPEFVVNDRLTMVITGANLGVEDEQNTYLDIRPNSPTLTLFPEVSPTVQPAAIYLSWQRDPTTTMTIQWHTHGQVDNAEVSYGPLDGSSVKTLPAKSHRMVFTERYVHTVEIEGLEPATEYRFRLNNLENSLNSRYYKFRTMPTELDRPIRMAMGGDVRMEAEMMERMNRLVTQFDPEFIVWGGDLAYSDGREDYLYREIEFFDVMRDTLTTEDGRIIPAVVGVGNHEVYLGRSYYRHEENFGPPQDTDEYREKMAPYFFNLFAFPGHPGYNSLDFGDYMTLVLPDSGHLGPIEGKQTEWLKQVLTKRKHVPHLIPVYHVPAYPSHRSFTGRAAVIREHWVPLFEEAGVRIAFEHHDHAFKRTVPLLGNEVNPNGIVYIGDGAWGVPTRPVHDPEETWYLEKASAVRHFILLTIHGESQDAKVFNEFGKLIDHHISRPWSIPQN